MYKFSMQLINTNMAIMETAKNIAVETIMNIDDKDKTCALIPYNT